MMIQVVVSKITPTTIMAYLYVITFIWRHRLDDDRITICDNISRKRVDEEHLHYTVTSPL